ncbi:MAG: transcriptional repressor [Paludibacteraceae bacterium]|nr:transcriptional repressor [Paludibacteraceae bacterium]
MKSHSPYNQASVRLNEYLKAHRLKPTFERDLILQTIAQIPHPVSPTEIAEEVKVHHISRSTVYNTFKLFCLARILSAITSDNSVGQVRYELCSDKSNSIQMVCTRCGRTVAIHDKTLTHLISQKKYNNFNYSHFTLTVKGECKVCRKIKGT